MKYLPVIGFEIHVELNTNSKMFCGCPADHFGKAPNTQTCPVCLGLPGALPVPNRKAIDGCLKLGLVLGCRVNRQSKFDRKNYFYPDLAKGYQISQYDQPFCFGGSLTLSSGKVIRITRVHMEEDTGKLQHQAGETLIDFNRSGVPLVEIVTEPDFADTAEVDEFLKEVQQIIRDLAISTADMEKGSLRLEANISVRPENQVSLPNYKIEVKNVNSFRFIKKAIDYEITRQSRILESGKIPLQETRGFSESRGETVSQRLKEGASDYRYFPEPDIPPFNLSSDYIDRISKSLPELTSQKTANLVQKYGLKYEIAHILCTDTKIYTLFTQSVTQKPDFAKKIADILVNKRFGDTKPSSKDLIRMVSEVKSAEVIDLVVITAVLKANPKAVSDYQSGKQAALFFLLGQVKKQLPEADPDQIRKALIDNISK